MRLNEKSIEVFLKSQTEGNPYEVGEQAKLIYGLYCETVIGMGKSSVENLFTYDKSHQTQGTSGESSAGIGLMLANEFMIKNDISINVESKIEKGTIFKLTI